MSVDAIGDLEELDLSQDPEQPAVDMLCERLENATLFISPDWHNALRGAAAMLRSLDWQLDQAMTNWSRELQDSWKEIASLRTEMASYDDVAEATIAQLYAKLEVAELELTQWRDVERGELRAKLERAKDALQAFVDDDPYEIRVSTVKKAKATLEEIK